MSNFATDSFAHWFALFDMNSFRNLIFIFCVFFVVFRSSFKQKRLIHATMDDQRWWQQTRHLNWQKEWALRRKSNMRACVRTFQPRDHRRNFTKKKGKTRDQRATSKERRTGGRCFEHFDTFAFITFSSSFNGCRNFTCDFLAFAVDVVYDDNGTRKLWRLFFSDRSSVFLLRRRRFFSRYSIKVLRFDGRLNWKWKCLRRTVFHSSTTKYSRKKKSF